MPNIRRIKACITVKNGELTCPNPIVVFGKHKDILQNCEYKDGCINLSILEDDYTTLEGKCISYTIICENCGTCPTKDGEICFCDNSDDCNSCQNCVGGICKDKCPDKICTDGTCTDCIGNDCPCNQKCIDGKCKCPNDKPYQNEEGCCYGCKSDIDCGPCFKCDGSGNCVPRDCGDGICHPLTGVCVDCVDNTKCKTNERCVDGKCECAQGYYFNPVTGKCEQLPDCFENKDCKDCENCVGGKCQPVECPKGTKCVGDQCIDDPCESATCNDGADCGIECGCKGTVCTECAKLSCADCASALGCVCNPSTGACEKVKDCEDTCVTKFDCSDGCGCVGGSCKNCANYSCEDCAKVDGCKCVNGKCGDDGDDECKDTFKLEADLCDKAELTAELKKDVPCNCPELDFSLVKFNLGARAVVTKVVGGSLVGFDDETSPYISKTEHQVKDSSFTIGVAGTYTKKIVDTLTGATTLEKGVSFQSAPRDTGTGTFYGETPIGTSVQIVLAGFEAFEKITLTYTHTGTTVVDTNCKYPRKVIYENSDPRNFRYNGGGVDFISPIGLVTHERIQSTGTRKPLFVWYKSANNQFDGKSIIRRTYREGTNTFKDKIVYGDRREERPLYPYTEKNLFEAGFSYKVTNDCSCDKSSLYLFDCEKGNFFEEANLNFTIENCGKKITIGSVPACSDMHQVVQYQIILDGVVRETSLGANFPDGLVYVNPDGFKTLQLKAVKEGMFECTKDFEIPPTTPPKLVYTTVCKNGTTEFRVSKDGIESITDSEGINTYNPTGSNYEILTTTKLDILVTYTSGCTALETLVPTNSCCTDLAITFVGGATEKNIYFTGELNYSEDILLGNFPAQFTGKTDKVYAKYSREKISIDKVFTNSDSVKITIFDTSGCEKYLFVNFIKLAVEILIDKTIDCEDTVVRILGEAGANFKVETTCGVVWEGKLGADGKAKYDTDQVSGTTCRYTLREYKGQSLVPAPFVSFEKKRITSTLDFSINNTVSICENKYIELLFTNFTGSITGLKVNYTLGDDVLEGVVSSANTIRIPVNNNTDCGESVSITINNLSSSIECTSTFPPVERTFPIPCTWNTVTKVVCNPQDNKPYLELIVPVNIIRVELTNSGNTYVSTTSTTISGVTTFKLPLFSGAVNISLLGSSILNLITGNTEYSYCSQVLGPITVPSCTRTPLTFVNRLVACLSGVVPNEMIKFSNRKIKINGLKVTSDVNGRENNFTIKVCKSINSMLSCTTIPNSEYSFNGLTGEISINDIAYGAYQVGATYSIQVEYNSTTDTVYTAITPQTLVLELEKTPDAVTAPLRVAFGLPTVGPQDIVTYQINPNILSPIQPFLLSGDRIINLSPNQLSQNTFTNIFYFYHLSGEVVRNIKVNAIQGTVSGLLGETNVISKQLNPDANFYWDPILGILQEGSIFQSAVLFPTIAGTYVYEVSYTKEGFPCSSEVFTITINIESVVPTIDNAILLGCLGRDNQIIGPSGMFTPNFIYKINGICYNVVGQTTEEPTVLGYDTEHTSCVDCDIDICGCGTYIGGLRSCNCENSDSVCFDEGQGLGCLSFSVGSPCVCSQS